MVRIGIGEEQPLAAREIAALEQRPRFADPALGKLGAANDPQTRIFSLEALENRRRRVDGPVVDHDDFEVDPSCAKSERTQRSIERSSSRAGTTIEMRGKRSGRPGKSGNSTQLEANEATRDT